MYSLVNKVTNFRIKYILKFYLYLSICNLSETFYIYPLLTIPHVLQQLSKFFGNSAMTPYLKTVIFSFYYFTTSLCVI